MKPVIFLLYMMSYNWIYTAIFNEPVLCDVTSLGSSFKYFGPFNWRISGICNKHLYMDLLYLSGPEVVNIDAVLQLFFKQLGSSVSERNDDLSR